MRRQASMSSAAIASASGASAASIASGALPARGAREAPLHPLERGEEVDGGRPRRGEQALRAVSNRSAGRRRGAAAHREGRAVGGGDADRGRASDRHVADRERDLGSASRATARPRSREEGAGRAAASAASLAVEGTEDVSAVVTARLPAADPAAPAAARIDERRAAAARDRPPDAVRRPSRRRWRGRARSCPAPGSRGPSSGAPRATRRRSDPARSGSRRASPAGGNAARRSPASSGWPRRTCCEQHLQIRRRNRRASGRAPDEDAFAARATAIEGHIDESIRLPGATAFTSPWIEAVDVGLAGPRREVVHLVVPQKAEARRDAGVAEGVVERRRHRRRPSPSRPRPRSASSWASRRARTRGRPSASSARGSIEATSRCRRGRFRNGLWRTPAKAGSPSQRLRSRNARFSISASQCIASTPGERKRPVPASSTIDRHLGQHGPGGGRRAS